MRLLVIPILILFYLGSLKTSEEKTYHKTFYSNGQLEAEGWMLDKQKTNYWYFYNINGSLKEKGEFKTNNKHGYWYYYDTFGNLTTEGHYSQEQKTGWWIVYKDQAKQEIQFANNMKHGFSLWYLNNKLIKVERFNNDLKEGEWTSVLAFKRDNPNAKF